MDIGCLVPFGDTHDLASFVPRVATGIEARGFGSLWLGEHTHLPVDTDYPSDADKKLPERYRRFPDPWAVLAASSSITSRVRLGTLVALVAEHQPLVLAKTIATVDQLSRGRVEVGVGYGWNKPEMVNNGIDPRRRRTHLRENVMAMRALWSGEPRAFDGDVVRFTASWSLPAPVQRPGPKIHLGCSVSERNIADVLAIADGFFPHRGLLSDDPRVDIARLRTEAEAAGRDPASIEIGIVYSGTSWGRPDLERFTRRLPSVRELQLLEEFGVGRVVCSIPAGPGDLFERSLDAWSERAEAAGFVLATHTVQTAEERESADIREIRQALYRAVRAAGSPDEVEMLSNSEMEIRGDTARVTSVRLLLGGDTRTPRILAQGRVRDEFVRAADGRWAFRRRAVADHDPAAER
jgi:probable F420-dependent oxidoreductase